MRGESKIMKDNKNYQYSLPQPINWTFVQFSTNIINDSMHAKKKKKGSMHANK